MEALYATIAAQIAVVGMLFRWLQVQTRDNRTRLDKTYSKDETKEAIDLRNAPIILGINHVKEELIEVKAMLLKLLDAKK